MTMFDTTFTADTQRQAAEEGHAACVAKLAQAIQAAVQAGNRRGSKHASVPTPRSQFAYKVTDEVAAELRRRGFRLEERGFEERASFEMWW